MSGSLRPTEIHRRRKRQEKRRKLRARLSHAAAHERGALKTKLRKTYPVGSAAKPPAT